jgi:hypothetical protein
MAFDLAVDFNYGDLLVGASKDIEVRTGIQSVEQRIRARLHMYQGEWSLDPTGGRLGSTLHDVTRLPNWRAVQEIPLVVKEALAPMEDIDVRDVQAAINPDDPRQVEFAITYALRGDTQDQSITLSTMTAG